MLIHLKKNGEVVVDFQNDLLVTSYKSISVNNETGKQITICNAEIIGNNLCGHNIKFVAYIKQCIRSCIKRYVK